MPELPGNGGGSRFELGPVVLDQRFEGLLEIIVALDDQLAVEKQVHFAQAQLPHLGDSRVVVAGPDEFFKEVLGNGGSRLVVACEQVEAFPFPKPILHDL